MGTFAFDLDDQIKAVQESRRDLEKEILRYNPERNPLKQRLQYLDEAIETLKLIKSFADFIVKRS